MIWRIVSAGLAFGALVAGFVTADRINAASCHVRICGFERP